jgi:hypothetical protein
MAYMLTHLGTRFSVDKISRGVEDQRGQIIAHHVIATRCRRHWHIAARMECDCAITGPATVTALISWLSTTALVSSISLAVRKLAPVRKRGRSTTRDKALERDRDLSYVNPARWRKQDMLTRPVIYGLQDHGQRRQKMLLWLG